MLKDYLHFASFSGCWTIDENLTESILIQTADIFNSGQSDLTRFNLIFLNFS